MVKKLETASEVVWEGVSWRHNDVKLCIGVPLAQATSECAFYTFCGACLLHWVSPIATAMMLAAVAVTKLPSRKGVGEHISGLLGWPPSTHMALSIEVGHLFFMRHTG